LQASIGILLDHTETPVAPTYKNRIEAITPPPPSWI
jgi:hypothetical protein